MQKNNKITISERGKNRILSGHKWVYKSDIIENKSDYSDIVYIYDKKRHFLGTAFYSKDSQISLRLISSDEIGDISVHIEKSLIEAIKYRQSLNLIGDCMRIVHSEADNLPGLIIDKYADTIVFQTLTCPVENLKDIITKKIVEVLNPKQIFEKNDSTSRQIERLPRVVRTIYGDERESLFCTENHQFFFVDLINSQKTSEYLDQKINREIVSRYAGEKILDLFCYHGWFGCNIKNYNELILVDSSKEALTIAKRNLHINQKRNFKIKEGNVFDILREYEKKKERFDIIILDPPGFIKSRKDIKSGYSGYKEINLRSMKILNRGGILATFSCSYYMSDEEFLNMLRDASKDAKTEFVILEYLRQSPDHREILCFPESHYLKGFILKKV